MEPFDDYVTTPPSFNVKVRKKKPDIISQPSHYARYAIEPMNYIVRNHMEFWRGNVVKYASRAGFKQYDGMTMVESEITDLQKAIRYCEARINHLKGETTL